MTRSFLPLLLSILSLCGCGDDDSRSDGGDTGDQEGTHVRYALGPDPMPFGSIPFPDDLYLGANGRVAVSQLPLGTSAVYEAAVESALSELSGFGVASSLFVPLDGAVDPATLPRSTQASLMDTASVFLVDVDPSSPAPLERVPIEAGFDEGRSTIVVRPAASHPLAPSRRYALVVTDRVRDPDGEPLIAGDVFQRVRDASTRPADPIEGEAYDEIQPVLASLETRGVTRDDVVALAVFRAQPAMRALRDALARVGEAPAPALAVSAAFAAGVDLDRQLGPLDTATPGVDGEGGIAHASIGFMVHGTLEATSYIEGDDGARFPITREVDSDAQRVRGTSHVPFTLVLPRDPAPGSTPLRLAIMQHDLGAERSSGLPVAEALASAGHAVILIDAPFHGMRANGSALDTRNRFTFEETADGFADVEGSATVRDFAGLRGDAQTPGDPADLTSALFQTVVDWATVLRAFRAGDLAPIRGLDPSLAGLSFAPEPMVAIGHGMLGSAVALLAPLDDRFGAVVILAGGGSITRAIGFSAGLEGTIGEPYLRALGVDEADLARDTAWFEPALALQQTLFDRADPLAYASAFEMRPIHVLMAIARDDEQFPNLSSERLASALGAGITGSDARYFDLPTLTLPVRGNATIAGDATTRVLHVFEDATHEVWVRELDERHFASPVEPPFEATAPREVDNPIGAALAQVSHFVESYRAGSAEVISPSL